MKKNQFLFFKNNTKHMIITDNSKLYERLRQEYPYFVFEKYEIIYHDVNLTLCFHFNLSDKYFLNFLKSNFQPL